MDMGPDKNWLALLDESLARHSPHIRRRLREWVLNVDGRCAVIADNLAKFTPLQKQRLLDFGCGEGGVALYFAKLGLDAWGADVDQSQLRRAELRARESGAELKTSVIGKDGRAAGLSDAQFDIVLCMDVIEHCADAEASLGEMKRLLKNDGLIYMTTPNRLGPSWIFADPHYDLPLVSVLPKPIGDRVVKLVRGYDNDVVHLFSPPELDKLFRRAGLSVAYSYPDVVLDKIRQPEKIVSSTKRNIFHALNTLKAASAIKTLLPAVHLFSDSLIYILKPRP